MELTVEITNFCEEGCDFCSSDAKPEGGHLSFDKIKEFLDSYKDVQRINISGGEPLAHPDFYKILRYCEGITKNVWVYSNAIKNLAYNSHVIREVNVAANVCMVPGKAVYIPKGSFSVHVLKFIPQGRGKDKATVSVSTSKNFTGERCPYCEQPTLLADGRIAHSPCLKEHAFYRTVDDKDGTVIKND